MANRIQEITRQSPADILVADANFKALDSAIDEVESSIEEINEELVNMGGLSNVAPLMNGTAAAGIANAASRSDHVHPSDTAKLNAAEKGVANGVASLNANSKVTAEQASAQIFTITNSATPSLNMAGGIIKIDNNLSRSVPIPTNSSVAFPIGTEMEFIRWNTGAVTFLPASGVTVRSVDSNLSIANQYGVAVLKKMDTNEWLLVGDLE